MKKLTCFTAVAAVLLSGCAPKLGGNDYAVSGAGEISQTHKGVILSMRKVNFEGTSNAQTGGAVAGGVAGAALGSAAGGGRGSLVTMALGGVAGALAGNAIGKAASEQDGLEYTVKLSDGSTITLAQGIEPLLRVGQNVLVIRSDRGRSRIVADN